jgi:outer membrane protein assembly factor BamB
MSAALPATPAADYPQFLGPHRNGILDEPALATHWTTHPPRQRWRQPVGPAWSGFVIVGNRAITQEQNGGEEWVSAFDVVDGRRLWTHTNEARYATTIAGEGPRATPTVVSNRVYTLGATGHLHCLDVATGQSLWSRSLTQDAGCSVPEWGFAGSPWVDSERVVVQAGGRDGRTVLAYRPDTGEPLWSAGDAGINYGSPFQVTLAGQPQLLVFGRKSLVSHNPSTGDVLWEHPFGTGMPLVANPIVISSNQVLITAGYSVGAELLELSSPTNAPRTVWTSKRLKAKFANPIKYGEFVYGLDDGILACLDLKDGNQRWKEGRYGHGQGLWIQHHYLLMSETGDLILLQPTPDGPHELARIRVFDSKTWNPIALSGDRLLVRNDREAACFQVPLHSMPAK